VIVLMSLMSSLVVLGAWPQPASAEAPRPSMCPELDLVQYSEPRDLLRERVVVESQTEFAGRMGVHRRFEEIRSPFRTARALVSPPDFKQNGPWTTVIAVRGNQVRELDQLITIRDHGSGGVKPRWLNEKLLWLRVWWGRVVATEIVLDVETGGFVYFEEADYLRTVLDCEEKERVMAEEQPQVEEPG
jgi:hypothetical protein